MGVTFVEREGYLWGNSGVSHCNQWGLCGVVILCHEGGDAAFPKLPWISY